MKETSSLTKKRKMRHIERLFHDVGEEQERLVREAPEILVEKVRGAISKMKSLKSVVSKLNS